MLIAVNTVPKIIELNPFRILGVYANSPKKDIIANKGKASAFIKVNRPVEFPLDLNGILPSIIRSVDMLNEAEGSIAIAKEQIKVAQFWFLKITALDEIAFNYLVSGDMVRAKEIWSKHESLSSLQNKIVCYLIEDKPWLALKGAEKLYEKFGDTYINKVDASSTIRMSSQDLLHQFIDTLGAEIGMQKLLGYELSDDTKNYIGSQTIGPLVNRILSEVEKTKKVNHNDAKARIEAARNLVRHTKDDFSCLKSVLRITDPQYQMVADKLGLEILQCGIDYFNNSDDDDRHQTAMKMQKYAQSVVVGTLAKQRCEENVKILQRIIDELPPSDALVYEHYIENSLSRFINKMPNRIYSASNKLGWLKDYIKECGPLISSIRDITGAHHPYYLKKSTDIVDFVLTHIIDIVNSSLETIKESYSYRSRVSIEEIRDVVKAAWLITLMMDRFDMHPSFKQVRYNPNRNLLKDIVDQARVYVGKPDPVDMRSEKQMLSEIKNISDCDCFLSIFPDSRHKDEVEEKRRIFRFNACNCLKDCHDLQRDYPNRKAEIDKLRDKIIYRELERCESIEDYESFIYNFPNSKYVDEAHEKKDELIRNKRRKKIRNTIIWILVILVIAGIIGFLYWDSSRKRELADQKAKQAEYNLYDNIVNKGDSLLCDDFIRDYPDSKYVGQVKSIKEEYEFRHLSTIGDCIDFKSKYFNSQYASLVDSIIDKEVGEMRKIMINDNINFDSATVFISRYGNVPNASIQSLVHEVKEKCSQILKEEQEREDKLRQDSIKKEEEARKREEYEKYGTDANAWKTASSTNSISAYQDYIKRYPRGKHVDAANKKIIDLEVQKVINSGDYGHLPSSQKVSYGTGRYSTINITSRCDRTITIMYSGVKSMKIIIAPYQSRSVVLPSSTYKVVATAPGVRSFYGTENLTGGDYESEYYISTSRY